MHDVSFAGWPVADAAGSEAPPATVEVWRFDGPDTASAARAVLARRTGRPPEALDLAVGPHGKPYLRESRFGFNLSHSGGLRLLALADGLEVGVDVERLRPLRRREALLARCFTARERRRLAAATDRELLRHWAAKEALVKAIGRGIAYGLRRIELDEGPDGGLVVARLDGPGGPAERWRLIELPPIDGAVAMLAQPAPGRAVRTLRVAGATVGDARPS